MKENFKKIHGLMKHKIVRFDLGLAFSLYGILSIITTIALVAVFV